MCYLDAVAARVLRTLELVWHSRPRGVAKKKKVMTPLAWESHVFPIYYKTNCFFKKMKRFKCVSVSLYIFTTKLMVFGVLGVGGGS